MAYGKARWTLRHAQRIPVQEEWRRRSQGLTEEEEEGLAEELHGFVWQQSQQDALRAA